MPGAAPVDTQPQPRTPSAYCSLSEKRLTTQGDRTVSQVAIFSVLKTINSQHGRALPRRLQSMPVTCDAEGCFVRHGRAARGSSPGFAPQAQVFRSIDSDSAEGFPASNAEAAHLGLDSNKGRVVEFSIQKAYINAIRQARALRQACMDWRQHLLSQTHAPAPKLSVATFPTARLP